VGGGLKFAGADVPLLPSPVQQALLGVLGSLMIVGSFLVRDLPEGGVETRGGHKLLGALGGWASTVIALITSLVAVVGVILIEVDTSPPAPPSQPAACAGQIAPGQTLACSVEQPTQVRTHTFPGVAGQQVRVTASRLSGDFTPAYEIHRPDGSRLCGTIHPALDCRLDASGRHTITVGAFVNHGTGRYSLSVTQLDSARSSP
jgi:hypothetical protein